MRKIPKNRYIQCFCLVVIVLAVVREFCHKSEKPSSIEDAPPEMSVPREKEVGFDEFYEVVERDIMGEESVVPFDPSQAAVIDTTDNFRPHRIYSVKSFDEAFPDSNHVHMVQSLRWGIPQLMSTDELSKYRKDLVYIGSNPYFAVDKLTHSVPYLVPRASVLLQDIGKNFFDSLQIKGLPLHKIVVTSVLRSKNSVEALSRSNGNASPNSCHQYATTVDISYIRFATVEAPDGPKRREVRNDSLKYVLSEVLNDLRQNGRCWVKYEKKQSCFHVTVR